MALKPATLQCPSRKLQVLLFIYGSNIVVFFFSLYVKSKSVPKSVIDLKPLATFILVTMKATSTSDLRLAIPEQFKFT